MNELVPYQRLTVVESSMICLSDSAEAVTTADLSGGLMQKCPADRS